MRGRKSNSPFGKLKEGWVFFDVPFDNVIDRNGFQIKNILQYELGRDMQYNDYYRRDQTVYQYSHDKHVDLESCQDIQ